MIAFASVVLAGPVPAFFLPARKTWNPGFVACVYFGIDFAGGIRERQAGLVLPRRAGAVQGGANRYFFLAFAATGFFCLFFGARVLTSLFFCYFCRALASWPRDRNQSGPGRPCRL